MKKKKREHKSNKETTQQRAKKNYGETHHAQGRKKNQMVTLYKLKRDRRCEIVCVCVFQAGHV